MRLLRSFIASLALSIGWTAAAQGGPRNALVHGNREFAYSAQVFHWVPREERFQPRQDLPPIYHPPAPEVVDIAWDGALAYRVVMENERKELQYGMNLMTPTGPAWFWRPGMLMPEHSELVIAAGRRALVRQEVPVAPGGAQEKGLLQLWLFDLVEGTKTIVDQETGWPSRMTVAGCVLEGDIYAFFGTGRILRLKKEGQTTEVVTDNFWSELPIPLGPFLRPFLGKTIYQAPSFLLKPFFSENGALYFVASAPRKNPESMVAPMAAAAREFFARASPEHKKILIDRGSYPVKEDTIRNADWEGLFFLEWRPESKTMHLLGKEKWSHLTRVPSYWPEGMQVPDIDGFLDLASGLAPYQVAADGRLQALDSLCKYPRANPAKPTARPATGAPTEKGTSSTGLKTAPSQVVPSSRKFQ